MGSARDSDEVLLERWRGGDDEAGNALLQRYYDGLLRFFALRTFDAEDLVQKTLMGCVEGRDRITSTSSFRAYVFGIARRQLFQQIRRVVNTPVCDEVSDFVADRPTSLSTLVARRQEHLLLVRGIAALELDLQLVLQLYYWEGLKTAEVADALEVPASTVTTRLARARDALRTKLRQLDGRSRAHAQVASDLDRWIRSIPKRPRLLG